MIQDSVLALTDQAVLPVSAVYNAIKEIKEGNERVDPLVITQAASIGVSLLCHLNFFFLLSFA